MCKETYQTIFGGDDKCYSNKTSVSEMGRTFELKRPKKSKEIICCIEVDGCLIQDASNKCDYLLIRCENAAFYFVELKGRSDITHGLDQLKSTIKHIQKKLKEYDKQNLKTPKIIPEFHSFIVCRSVPKGANSQINKAKERFRKEMGHTPKVISLKAIEQLPSL